MGPPTSVAAFPAWLARGVLNPSHAMFREWLLICWPRSPASRTARSTSRPSRRSLQAERRPARWPGHSVGRRHRSPTSSTAWNGRASSSGQTTSSCSRRPTLRITDAMLRFQHAVIRPDVDRFESRQTLAAWSDAAARFESGVAGPAFEEDRASLDLAVRLRGPACGNRGPRRFHRRQRQRGSLPGGDRCGRPGGPVRRRGWREADAPPDRRGEERAGPARHGGPAPTRAGEGAARGSGARGTDSPCGLRGRRLHRRASRDEATRRSDVVLVDVERLYAGD